MAMKNGGRTRVGPYTPLSNAINMLTRSLGIPILRRGEEAAITDLAFINTPVFSDTLAATPPASEKYTVYITETTTITSSPFLKLPGELRNRVYHLYFEDFEEQMSRRFLYNESKMSPNCIPIA